MKKYQIKDLETLSGIKSHTLRMWEQRYHILDPSRTDTNIRFYSDDDLKRLLKIALLNKHGYKISKIADMSEAEMVEHVKQILEEKTDYDAQVQALTLSMIEMDEGRFEKLISTAVLRMGFEEVMMNIVFPFLERIGVMWMTGSINPAQEHFISNLIRQKVIVAIDGQVVKASARTKKFVLFCPQWEQHELGLLFANYLIRKRGSQTVYLGASVPFTDLQSVCEMHQPDYLYISISTTGEEDIQKYIDKLAATFPKTQILASGFQVVEGRVNPPNNLLILQSMKDTVAFCDALSQEADLTRISRKDMN